MSFFYGDAQIPTNFTAAGGVAGLSAIADAAQKQMQLVDNSNASYAALYQAYDDRIAAIKQATGQAVENPLKLAEQQDFDKMRAPRLPMYKQPRIPEELQIGPRAPTNSQKQAQQFSNWLAQMQQQFPEASDRIRANVPIERDAEALAKKAEEDANQLAASRGGLTGLAAQFYGGFKGTLNDPLQVTTMFIGGGPGVGRNVALRIANVALKEALVNGGLEAAQQPAVQAWREKAGLPNGWKEGIVNTLFAATAGGLFGAAGEAAGAAAKRIFKGRELDAVVAEVRKTAPLTPEILKALDGDVDAAIKAITPIREALPAEARAAIDQHEVSQEIRQQIAQPTDMHERNMDAASAAVLDPARETFTPEVDQAKVDRVAALLVPEAAPTRKAERDSLQGFLARAGGIQDQKGEVSALGLQNATPKLSNKKGLTYTKRLVRDNGMVLDQARKVAAEAGYFNHKYGTVDLAMEKSTIVDLLDELENESRRVDMAEPDNSGRRYAEQRANDLLQIIGPDVDDALVARAIQRAERDGIDPVEAFDIEARSEDGFTIDGFHGTNAVFDQFDPLRLGENTGAKSASMGFFFSKSPETAHAYLKDGELIIFEDIAGAAPEDLDKLPRDVRANVKKLINDAQKANEKAITAGENGDDFAYEELSNISNDLWERARSEATGYLEAGNNIKPVKLRMNNPFVKDFEGRPFRDEPYSSIIAQAKKAGHDGVILKNTFDGAGKDDIFVVFSADQIRSRFDIGDVNAPRSPDPFDFPGDRSEPDFPNEDDMLTAADLEDFDPMMEIPFFDDGRSVTASQMLDELDEMDRLFQATEVCRL